MINLKLLRQEFEKYKKKINSKDPSFDVDILLQLDLEVLQATKHLEQLQEQSNKIAETIKQKGISEELKEAGKKIKQAIENQKTLLDELYKRFLDIYLRTPNIPLDELPLGGKEQNKVLRKQQNIKYFSFDPLPYYELKNINNFISFETGTAIAGSGFPVYKDKVADIIHALTRLFLLHNKKWGFVSIIPPSIINKTALTAASNLPRFQDDVFTLTHEDGYLIPTSEVSLAFMHHDTILNISDLPLRYTALTNCFRKEAGGYGAQERGIMRMHEFQKVEIFSFCEAEKSEEEHQYLLACVEQLLQNLELHYQVVLLSTQDCSFAAQKTYDLEVFLPGTKVYKEVSSISNCGDFQARRSKTRVKSIQGENQLVHTLNGSSLAIPRILIALLETYQNQNGEIDFIAIENCINNAYNKINFV